MLTEKQKQAFIWRFRTGIQLFGKPFAPCKPSYAALYAFEMSDNTVKLGVSKQVEKRSWQVANATGLDVLRVHQTDSVPEKVAFSLEKRLHRVFFERNARNEFFNITFEEAVAALDELADEIAAEREKAEQLFKDECEFFEILKASYLDRSAPAKIAPLTGLAAFVQKTDADEPVDMQQNAKALSELAAIEREKLALEREKLALEREKLAVECEKLAVEREKLAVEREKLALEREKLTLEREKLAVELAKLVVVNSEEAKFFR